MLKINIPIKLIQEIIANKCILFAGSGLSAGIKRSNNKSLPTWPDLLKELLEWSRQQNKINCQEYNEIISIINNNDLLVAAQILKERHEQKSLNSFYQSIFKDPALKPTTNHHLISQIPFRSILTSNYDALIEDTFTYNMPLIFTQEDLEKQSHLLKSNDFFIFKLHGDINTPETIVLGSREYNELFFRNPQYKIFLETLFLTHTILFIGYSATDNDINLLLDKLSFLFKKGQKINIENTENKSNKNYHYILLPQGVKNTVEKEWLFKERNLAVIEYEVDETHSQIFSFLKEVLDKIKKYQLSIEKPFLYPDKNKIILSLWNNSMQYYKRLRGLNGKFCNLNINDIILPNIKDLCNETIIEDKIESKLALQKNIELLWNRPCRHALILGNGGMGKTISQIRLWDTYLNKNQVNNPIPLFLSLNEYNNVSTAYDRDNYIIKTIGRIYFSKRYISLDDENSIWEILKTPITLKSVSIPSVILFLDGYNEITVPHDSLKTELKELIRDAYGLQIIISSRYDMCENLGWHNFNKLSLEELRDDQVTTYLIHKKIPMPFGKLLDLVRNPMMLTIYAQSCDIIQKYKSNKIFDFKHNIQSIGELIWNFIETQLVKVHETSNGNISRTIYFKFLLKHLLPFIGFEMEKAGQYYFNRADLEIILNRAYQAFNVDQFLNTFSYLVEEEEQLELNVLNNNYARKRFKRIKDIFCFELNLLVVEDDSFHFLHEHFRDFFASIHILNEIQIGITTCSIPNTLKKEPLSSNIRLIIGQIEGEHYNKPRLLIDQHRWSIDHYTRTDLVRILDYCRGKFEMDEIGFTIWNIVTIWKEVCTELTGADLSNLNLSGIVLNNIRCSRYYQNQYLTVCFNYSLLCEKFFLPQGHSHSVVSVSYSPDNKKIISGSFDNTIKEWSIETGECIKTLKGHKSGVTSVSYSPDGKRIVSGSWDNTIKEWSEETGQCLKTLRGHRSDVLNISYSPDGKKIISISEDGTIKEWSVETGECLKSIEDRKSEVKSVSFSPDGKRIITGLYDHTIKEWSIETGECMQTYFGHTGSIDCVCYSPDGKKIISGSWRDPIKEWSAETGECLNTSKVNIKGVHCINYSPDGGKIITGSWDTIIEWYEETGECLQAFKGHKYEIFSISYSPDSKKIISGSQDYSIKEWVVKTGECIRTFEGYDGWISCVGYSHDGKRIIVGSGDFTIKEWSIEKGICLQTFIGHENIVTSVDYSPDSKKIISGSWDNTIKEWSVETGVCLQTFKEHKGLINCVSHSPDGGKIISGNGDGVVKEWSVPTGECLQTFEGHEDGPITVSYSPNGEKIISASLNGNINEWSIETGQLLKIFEGHEDQVTIISYCPNGKRIISGSEDKTIKEWSTETGECLKIYKGHKKDITTICYSPDGKKFVSGSKDKTIKEWSTETGECLKTFKGHKGGVTSISYSPNGKRIISGSYDNTIKEWLTKTGKCLQTIINIPGLIIHGCSFNNIHPQSQISKNTSKIMYHYGANFDK